MKHVSFLQASLILAAAGIVFISTQARADEQAVVTGRSGEASIVRKGEPHEASVGMGCRKSDAIEVGTIGHVDLGLNGVAGCRFMAGTKGKLERVDSDEMRVAVTEGNILLNIKELEGGQTFTVETPVAIAAVRGTQFWGRVVPLNQPGDLPRFTMAVGSGSVDVTFRESGERITLGEGQAVDLSADRDALPEIRPAASAELEAIYGAHAIRTSL